MSVPAVPLSEVLTEHRDPVSVVATDVYPAIGILNEGRGSFKREDLLGAATKYQNLFRVTAGQVIFSKLKAFEGAIAIVPSEHHDHFVSSEFPTFTVGAGISIEYLAHVLRSDVFSTQLKQASRGLGARRERVHPRDFLQLEIPLPNIEEQRAIAARLDAVMRLSRQSQGAMSKNAELTSIIDSVSTAWQRKAHTMRSLGSIARISRGKSLRLDIDSDVTAIGQAAVRWRLERSLFKGIDSRWATTIPAAERSRIGELLVNSTGDGTIGRASIVDESTVGYLVDSHILRVRTHDPEDAELILLYLWSPTGRREIERIKGSTTTKQTELGISRLSTLSVPDFSTDQKMRYRFELRQLFAIDTEYRTLREQSLQLLKALPQAARNAEFARLTA